ncbi:hypothetical protein B0H11DRAFT_2355947 [Mycena galericulata]|nr:hypothetical protein B0H11DRAFT_2355947 [Mycena galericulata]
MYLTQVFVIFVLAIAGSASPCSGQVGGLTNVCVRQPGYDGKPVVSIDRSTSIAETVPNLPITNGIDHTGGKYHDRGFMA